MEHAFASKAILSEAAQLDLVDAPVSSDLDRFVAKAEKIAQSHPEILRAIENDQKAYRLKKKAIRLADQAYLNSQTPTLANLEIESSEPAAPTDLDGGCPRMPALVVLVFLLLRGWLGGPKSETFRILLRESITLRQFLQSQNARVPGPSTVADHINLVSAQTQQLILRCELDWAKQQNSFHDRSEWRARRLGACRTLNFTE